MRRNGLKRRMEHGQSFVELAISSVFLLFFVLGVVDVARIFYIYIALQDSSEAAAIYLAQHPTCTTNAVCPDPNNAEYRARNSSGAQINWSGPDVGVTPDTTTDPNMVSVKMTYNFTLITPVIRDIVGSDTIVLTGKASYVRLD